MALNSIVKWLPSLFISGIFATTSIADTKKTIYFHDQTVHCSARANYLQSRFAFRAHPKNKDLVIVTLKAKLVYGISASQTFHDEKNETFGLNPGETKLIVLFSTRNAWGCHGTGQVVGEVTVSGKNIEDSIDAKGSWLSPVLHGGSASPTQGRNTKFRISNGYF